MIDKIILIVHFEVHVVWNFKNRVMENIFLFFNALGPETLIIIFAILLLFGGRKIPELMRGIGKGISEFNRARASVEQELKEGMKEENSKS